MPRTSPRPVKPFMERVAPHITKMPDGCWLWMRCKDANGYGRTNPTRQSKFRLAHRLIYEALVGPIPRGLTIDHLCRVRSCVNPAHMEPVSVRENTLRGYSSAGINGRKTHCKRGHEFTAENTYRMNIGGRSCRECMRMHQANFRERRRGARKDGAQ